MDSAPKKPERAVPHSAAHESTLVFYRRRTWQDAFRRYRIEVDGLVVGKLSPRGTLTVPIAPGPHELRARIGWSGSPETGIRVAPGEVKRVYVGPAKGLPLQKAMGSRSWLVVVPDDGAERG